MSKKVKNKVLGILFFCLVAVGIFFCYGGIINQTYQGRAWSIESIISEFIRENGGRFPNNQQELIEKGYIKVEYDNEKPKYFVKMKYGNRVEWQVWPVHLEWFTIQYGAKKEDFFIADNRLYDKNTNKVVFLLDGPYNRRIEPSLRQTYNIISIKWYEAMK